MNTRGKSRREREMMEKCVTKEDWCSFCYVGGLLIFCNHEDCIKACHPKCMGEDDSFVNSGRSWTCDAHYCFECHKKQDFNCVACSKALCRRCIGQLEFVQIEGNKGLCGVCLKYGLLVEGKEDAEIDKKFMEHFSSAWKIIRERESLTHKDLRYAEDRMKKGMFYVSGCNSEDKKKSCSIPQHQYALIDPKNITLVYLKKNLVEELVKDPRNLTDGKLIGCFVKAKAARDDRFDQNIFKLLQVTGTSSTCSGESDPEILLQVSGMENNISIKLLSNGAVNEYECKDLKICIQRGFLKQPTVVELEHKAKLLHEDIMKHWITTELERLKIHFELMYERGRRREMIEYEKQWDCLLKVEEQEKLLNTIPHVVAAAEGELELLSKKGEHVEQEVGSSTSRPDGSHSGDPSFTRRNSSPRKDKSVRRGTKDSSFDGTYSIGRQCMATSHGLDISHLNSTAQLDNDDGEKEVMGKKSSVERKRSIRINRVNDVRHEKVHCSVAGVAEGYQVLMHLSASFEKTESDKIGPRNTEEGEQEKAEVSAAKVTEGNKEEEDNGPPSIPLDYQDLKWNIITPSGEQKGPYLLDDLKCIQEVLPYYSQYLMVCKEASRDAPISIKDAVDQDNSTIDVTEGNEEVNLRNLPDGYTWATELQPTVGMNEQDRKWKISVSKQIVKGTYSLKSLKCVHDIAASSSQYIIVWKEGEGQDTALKLQDAMKAFLKVPCLDC